MNTTPTTYTIRVDGHLDDHWSVRLGEPDMTRNDDGTTTITALIPDQAQLHGVLAGLRDIGAVITELRRLTREISRAGLRPTGLPRPPIRGSRAARRRRDGRRPSRRVRRRACRARRVRGVSDRDPRRDLNAGHDDFYVWVMPS